MNKHGATILVVDDDQEIVRVLRRSLGAHGYMVLVATSGEEAMEVVSQQRPDLLLLDLLLPGMSGQEVCRKVREASNIPIIVLSVKDTERDKVEALDLGADDYVAKPFGINEVLARVRVILRRVAQPPNGAAPCYQAGPLSVDFARRRVWLDGKEVSLTPTEYGLLKVFITFRDKVLTRQQLLKEVWGVHTHDRTHSLHVYVAQLRQKIEPAPERRRFILTIPGVGYCFAGEAER
jgi:two-component system, OmpR family, KDP operon response regulator KdpE